LDDPLSAVDVEVAKIIVSECIRGILKSKAVILVTHQVQHLQEADEILLFKNGHIESRGLFPDVIGPLESEVDVVDDLEMEPPRSHPPTTSETTTKSEGGYGTFKSSLDVAEQQTTGGVKFILHWKFWSAAGVVPAFSLLFLFILVQVFSSGADYWLRSWYCANAYPPTV